MKKTGEKKPSQVWSGLLDGRTNGQVTIFIIIAIVIIAAIVLVFMFFPNIKNIILPEEENPPAYIQSCLENDIKEAVDKLSLQGGSLNPEHYIVHGGNKIEYLCYTREYYVTCTMQQPFLKEHIEYEIKNAVASKINECFDSMKKKYEKKGYNVNLGRGDATVELLPKRIVMTFNSSLVLSRGSSEKYTSLKVVLNNNIYELVSIANSILNWEARYGKTESTTYMDYYHDLKVEPKLQSDGTTIYILTDRNNQNKFQFASRSVAWPPGYG